jgi:drug/metabolite transporter (DMT)-like permease
LLNRVRKQIPAHNIGLALLVLCLIQMASQSALVKAIGDTFSSSQIVFIRGAVGLLLIIPFVWRYRFAALQFNNLRLHLLRAFFGVSAMACQFFAYARLPLAEATAYSFTMPLFLTFLAVVFLREAITKTIWVATFAGFVGVLIISQPGQIDFELAGLVALCGAFFHAVVVVLIKKLSALEPTITLMLYFPIVAVIAFLVPALTTWTQPDLLEWIYLLLIAALGTCSQWCFIEACRRVHTPLIAPFDYTRIVFAGVIGYFFFSELPSLFEVSGMIVILASTLFITLMKGKQSKSPEPSQ